MLEERHFYRKPPREGSRTMAIIYKIDILEALKSKGYNTNKLRKEKILSESVIQGLRENRYITLPNISTICALLECQPGDLLEYVSDPE
ncbi:MAG: helix-turn-helix domain-containing protein [Bacteroidales bacterium]|nr:helix-turn-helix domain-containing protein [Bacteroidales bacterium]